MLIYFKIINNNIFKSAPVWTYKQISPAVKARIPTPQIKAKKVLVFCLLPPVLYLCYFLFVFTIHKYLWFIFTQKQICGQICFSKKLLYSILQKVWFNIFLLFYIIKSIFRFMDPFGFSIGKG